MATKHCIKHVKIPADVLLTPVVLVAAMRKLSTNTIADSVDALISELDKRAGDPDLEFDLDEE